MSRLKAMPGAQGFRALVASTLLMALTACGNGDPSPGNAASPEATEPAVPAAEEGPTGTLSFELRGVGGLTLNTFNYVITGPNYSKSGAIDVSNSTTVSARVDAIPAGTSYVVTLSGSGVGTPEAQCSGSASFDVLARSVTSVPVAINCHVQDAVVTPPQGTPTGAPVPPFFAWLCGLALLAIGYRFTSSQSGTKTLV